MSKEEKNIKTALPQDELKNAAKTEEEEQAGAQANAQTNAENGVKGVCSDPQMRYRTQILKRMAFFLQRILPGANAKHLDMSGINLNRV